MRILCGTILAAMVAATALGDSLGNIGDGRLKGLREFVDLGTCCLAI